MYSIICLLQTAGGPEEKFGLDRIRIKGNFMFSLRDKGWSVQADFNDLGSLDHVVKCNYTNCSWIIMNQTVNPTPWHNNKPIITLNDQTKIQWPLAWIKSAWIVRNRGCQILQLCNKETWFYVRNSKCTGFGIRRVLLYVSIGKICLDQTFCSD